MNAERVPIVLGGCAYHLQLRTEHAASVAMLASMIAYDDLAASTDDARSFCYELSSIDYQHTSNLPQGRCDWLRRAIGATHDSRRALAVSIDSDTSFDAATLLVELEVALRPDVAIALAPVRVGGTTLCNLNASTKEPYPYGPERRMGIDEITKALASDDREIASGGFGLAVFNLAWFRRRWAQPTPDGIEYTIGEDIAMCRAARTRGGKIVALRVKTSHHEFRP